LAAPCIECCQLAWVDLEECDELCGDAAPVFGASKAKGVTVQAQHAAHNSQRSLHNKVHLQATSPRD
jgi:hypothetical protein